MRFLRLLLGVLVALIAAGSVLTPAVPAVADDAVDRAREHFREGEKHYNLGEFADALREFKDSYRLKNDPVLLYNIGQCQLKLGDDRAALHSFRGYLRLASDPPNRQTVQEKMAQIEQRLGSHAATVTPEHPPGPAAPSFTRAGLGMPPAAPAPFLSTHSQRPEERGARPPLYRRWWVWAVAAGVVAGTVAAVVIVNRGGAQPNCLGVSPCGTLR